MKKRRIDQLLVDEGVVDSIEFAKRIIMAGEIFVDQQRVLKPSSTFSKGCIIERRYQKYVSRGGEKLAGALEHFHLQQKMQGAVVLDVGASTGGFTDCCLQMGAQKVVAIDVGHGQLHWKLRNHPQVEVHERTDIRKFLNSQNLHFDFVVADISFNSLSRLLPAILSVSLSEETQFVVLIKPQFELAKEEVIDGVVTDNALREKAMSQVEDSLTRLGCTVQSHSDSVIKGRSGNQEIFCHFSIDNLEFTRSTLKINDSGV